MEQWTKYGTVDPVVRITIPADSVVCFVSTYSLESDLSGG